MTSAIAKLENFLNSANFYRFPSRMFINADDRKKDSHGMVNKYFRNAVPTGGVFSSLGDPENVTCRTSHIYA